MSLTKTRHQLACMRRAGLIVAHALEVVREMVVPGITTEELDRAAESAIREIGGVPSFKGYRGFPATICTSVNEEVVHGFPGIRRLADGDIVSVDVGVIWEGYQGDAAITVAVGQIDADARRLLEATEAALWAGIEATRLGNRLGDISHAIEAVARAHGFAVVREYGGHGIGSEMHEPPRIPNWGNPGRGGRLKQGMTLALEPMLTLGGSETQVLEDGWTVVTADGSLAGHFEHTVAVTKNGAEILTQIPDGSA